jgi:hypothetical protein
MYLKVIYGWHFQEERGETAELDQAIKNCLEPVGFKETKARIDRVTGERRLEFETEETVIKPLKMKG